MSNTDPLDQEHATMQSLENTPGDNRSAAKRAKSTRKAAETRAENRERERREAERLSRETAGKLHCYTSINSNAHHNCLIVV